MNNYDIDDTAYLGSSENYHENGRPLSSYDQEEQAPASPESEFRETLKEAQEEEKGVWDTVKRVNSHSHVMLYLYNGTSETFELSSSSWGTAGEVDKYTVAPWDYLLFVLRADIPYFAKGRTSTQAKHNFIYQSDNHAFEFSTKLWVRKEYSALSFDPATVPLRENKIKSIGTQPLHCSSRIIRTEATKPYHYGVVISLGAEY